MRSLVDTKLWKLEVWRTARLGVLERMGITADIDIKDDTDKTVLEIQTKDTELVIGRRGVVMDALQHLVNRSSTAIAPATGPSRWWSTPGDSATSRSSGCGGWRRRWGTTRDAEHDLATFSLQISKKYLHSARADRHFNLRPQSLAASQHAGDALVQRSSAAIESSRNGRAPMLRQSATDSSRCRRAAAASSVRSASSPRRRGAGPIAKLTSGTPQ
jgi:hypothetical protein